MNPLSDLQISKWRTQYGGRTLQMTDFMTTKQLQLTWKYGKGDLGLSDLRNSKWI